MNKPLPLIGIIIGIPIFKGTLLGTPNREPQEYSRNIMVYKEPGKYIPIIYLLYSWGSQFGVPSRVPLILRPFKGGGSLIMGLHYGLGCRASRTLGLASFSVYGFDSLRTKLAS